ncbi:hypothetical protein HPB52_020284 [Rhipicephalus sanguineus]|uniref:Nlr family card domain protein n=1 Tax=Rhipicephalus sanguineus TaxID=34632 RepID=A0A9D4QBX9_RHISA|nr:hypothetical protein HPB52_020284 [Rhipicephalus sanguineus]
MPKRKRGTADQGGGSRRKLRSLMSDFVFDNSRFSGSSINYRTPCTSSEGQLCDIFRELTIWNEFFWEVGLELRELSPGQISLVKVDGTLVTSEIPRKHEAAMLLHRLLMCHRCLFSVVLNSYILVHHDEMICDELPRSVSLRQLRVSLRDRDMCALRTFAAVLPLLNNLQELDCRLPILERTFCEGLSKLLRSTASLTTLKLSAPDAEPEEGMVILHGLERNTTVTTLSVTMCMELFLFQCGVVFADYLSENQTLRTLMVTSDCAYDDDVDDVPNLIIRSLFRNTTISEVKLIGFNLGVKNSHLVAKLLSENRSLRNFHMVKSSLYGSGRIPETDGVSGRIRPWIVALGKNRTLERLTMELSCFNLKECKSLFKVLASNKSLKNITVERVRPTDEAEICRLLLETGVRERFFLSRPHVVEDPVVTLTECKELSGVTINTDTPRGLDSLHTALCLLPSCSHVTSLTLHLQRLCLNSDVISLMAQYFKSTTVLRDFQVILFVGTSNTVDRAERALMQALFFNKSIRKLCMTGVDFDETEIQMLVDKLEASRTLYELSFYPHDSMSTVLLIRKLSPNVSRNYMLLSMQVHGYLVDRVPSRELFTVNDVVGRNLSLVTRAAHFVMGTRNRYCAAAVELVHSNPGLLAKVQALASVDENEASSRIETSMKSFSELDDFMRMAGVVKYSVTCHRRDDGQLQLTDLNRDCWLYVRQHLKIGDIPDAQ